MNRTINPDEVRRLHDEGKTTAQIAAALGFSHTCAGNAQRRLGLKPNKCTVTADRRTLLAAWARRKGLSGDEVERYVEERLNGRPRRVSGGPALASWGDMAARNRRRAGRRAKRDLSAEQVERALDEHMISTCGRCGHTVEGIARDTIRRMRHHLDDCR